MGKMEEDEEEKVVIMHLTPERALAEFTGLPAAPPGGYGASGLEWASLTFSGYAWGLGNVHPSGLAVQASTLLLLALRLTRKSPNILRKFFLSYCEMRTLGV